MPGSEKGAAARGHDTTYDRLRSVSAIPVLQALYNYDTTKDHALASFVGFEADGTFMGFSGCRVAGHARGAFWVSSESNGGEVVRPELCPLGKHGYDPRYVFGGVSH